MKSPDIKVEVLNPPPKEYIQKKLEELSKYLSKEFSALDKLK